MSLSVAFCRRSVALLTLLAGLLLAPLAQAGETVPGESSSVLTEIDAVFGTLVGWIAPVLFVSVGGIPLIILILVSGGVIFTVYFGFINVSLFKHGVDCIRGKFDNPDDIGEISHFKALTSALAATVGLGNIAGVAVAISAGGPGAVFWMWLVAFFGMSLKFSSCTLAQVYRHVGEDGTVLGGPMVYLREGIADQHPTLAPLGKFFGVLFAGFIVLASFGGGNLFQAKLTYAITVKVIPSMDTTGIAVGFGLIMAVLVGLVIIGGIKRIGEVTCRMVPAMCAFYCIVCLIIILSNLADVPALLGQIVSQAFSPEAAFGGFLGVLVQGMKRAAFSNEAGLGSAAIAHAAAKTNEPVREGVVAMLGPFVDTLVVCTMTALTILLTGVNVGITDINWVEGAAMTADAFGSLGDIFKYLLIPAVAIFAFSTMVSWSYYGDRATFFLFGAKGVPVYRVIYTIIVATGPVLSLSHVLDFADMMILSLAFPNIIGSLLLAPKVKSLIADYVGRLKSGEMKPTHLDRPHI